MPVVRVREALANAACRATLRDKLPREATAPDLPKCGYPQNVLKLFGGAATSRQHGRPEDDGVVDKHATLGVVTELLLRRAVVDRQALFEVVSEVTGGGLPASMRPSAYLKRVGATKEKMLAAAHGGPLVYDTVVTGHGIEGHPGARTPDDIFEVKTSGRVQTCWTEFLLQIFAYAALDPSVKAVHLVLPLQEWVWSWDVAANWAERSQFRQALEDYAMSVTSASSAATPASSAATPVPTAAALAPTAAALAPTAGVTAPTAAALAPSTASTPTITPTSIPTAPASPVGTPRGVGFHVAVHGGLVKALSSLEDCALPYQVFLCSPTTTKAGVSEAELDRARMVVAARGLVVFAHAPYLVNLCSAKPYNVGCVAEQLRLGSFVGLKGIVVHVGKACHADVREALGVMRESIKTALAAASPECPLLLETPAGQGTEVLCGMDEFYTFLASFEDPRLGAVVDTCHVFATGVQPAAYLRAALENPRWRSLPRLVHFNDSERPLGSRVDRHAPPGCGHIGATEMAEVARVAAEAGVPLVRE